MAIATAKIVLWLGVVVTSLAAIGLLGRSTRPRYPQLERMRAQAEELRRSDQDLRRQLRDLERTRAIVESLQQRQALSADLARRAPLVLPPPPAPTSHRRR
ncbi:MAG: hypothetical protein IPL61_22665 [Myxococcales bacterium]|nr:hypothetical protein [Myxococcales bacterium]